MDGIDTLFRRHVRNGPARERRFEKQDVSYRWASGFDPKPFGASRTTASEIRLRDQDNACRA